MVDIDVLHFLGHERVAAVCHSVSDRVMRERLFPCDDSKSYCLLREMYKSDLCSISSRVGIPRKREASEWLCFTALQRSPACSVVTSKLEHIQVLMESTGSRAGR